MATPRAVLLTLVAALVIGAALIHGGGLINFAADEPHSSLINSAIEYSRERFIAARSRDIEVPDLEDPKRLANGAAHYVPMCAGCHLGPGTPDTEIRRGLYPQPPNLAQPAGPAGGQGHQDRATSAKRQFWIVKHGIKMTGMPAWGATHDDAAIWGLVAFLRKLPGMTPEEFAAMSQDLGAGGHRRGTRESDGMEQEEMPADAAGPAGHVDPPGATPHGHGARPQPAPKDEPHTDGHQH